MMIGSFSGIPYRHFLATLAPVAVLGLVLAVLVIFVAYRREFADAGARCRWRSGPVRVDRGLMWKSLVVSLAMIVMFFAGWPVPKVAIVAGALLLITRRVNPEKVYQRDRLAAAGDVRRPVHRDRGGGKDVARTGSGGARRHGFTWTMHFVLSGLSAVLSNLVSNVPAVLVFKPLVGAAWPTRTRAWLTLAMSSTLAGNLTVLGSVANLIVIQQARHKVQIGFWEYFRVGAPLAVLTILAGAAWIAGATTDSSNISHRK